MRSDGPSNGRIQNEVVSPHFSVAFNNTELLPQRLVVYSRLQATKRLLEV